MGGKEICLSDCKLTSCDDALGTVLLGAINLQREREREGAEVEKGTPGGWDGLSRDRSKRILGFIKAPVFQMLILLVI